MNRNLIKKLPRGFSLVELVIAITVFSLLAAGIALTIGRSTIQFNGKDDATVKERYAREAEEAVFAIRDNSWTSITSVPTSTAYDVVKNASGNWEFYHGTTTRNTLTRNVYLKDVERDSSGNIVASGGTWDPYTRKVVVSIEGGAQPYQLESYVSNWKSFRISQTDWDGTDAVEVWSGNDLADDIYSYNPTYNLGTSTAGSLKLQSSGAWYGANWGYRKKITVNHTKVSEVTQADLTNFTMLYSVTDTDLRDHVVQSDGGDIVFTDANNNKLDHEIENFTASTGALQAWVEVPTLGGTANTDIYIYYGNSTDLGDQWNKTGTWGNSYAAVYHMSEATWNGTSGEVKDSLGAKNATASGNATTTSAHSVIYTSGSFDGASDYFQTSASVMSGTNVTFGGWIYINIKPAAGVNTVPIQQADAADAGFEIYTYSNLRNTLIYCWDGTASTAGYTISAATWYHVYCVYDGSYMKLYVNGTQQGASVESYDPVTSSNLQVGGGAAQNTYWLNGKVDEVQVSNIVRSADWLATEYNNQYSPATFYNVDTQRTAAGYVSNGNATSTAAIISWSTDKKIINRDALTLQWAQLVPSGCTLDIYLQGTNTAGPNWTTASLIGPFNNTGSTSRVTTTVDLSYYPDISNKKWVRYGVSMASCNSGADTPTLYNISLDFD